MGNWQKVFPNIEPASLGKECWCDITEKEKTSRKRERSAFTPENLVETKDWDIERKALLFSFRIFLIKKMALPAYFLRDDRAMILIVFTWLY